VTYFQDLFLWLIFKIYFVTYSQDLFCDLFSRSLLWQIFKQEQTLLLYIHGVVCYFWQIEATKEYGMTKVNRTLETPLGKFALEKMNEALTVSEEYVEKYLPPSDEEMNNKGTNLCQFSSEVENRKVSLLEG